MATKQMGTVVGVFRDHGDARSAIRELKAAGFKEDQIGVTGANRDLKATSGDDAGEGNYAGEGAMAGVAAGAGLGALWGLGILAGVMPIIGPAIAGGTLAALLTSAAAGAAVAGLAGTLIGLGISKEEAEYYESEVKAGRTIVTVSAGNRRDEAVNILRRFHGYDMSTRDTATQSSAYAEPKTHASSAASHSVMAADASASSAAATRGVAGNSVKAHEEKLHVSKTPVQTGEAVVRKEVHTEHKTVEVPVTREELVIERRAGSGLASAADIAQGQEIRVPLREEQVHVEKQTVVAEEVSVGKRKVQDTEHVAADLRKEEIKVETTGEVDIREKRKQK